MTKEIQNRRIRNGIELEIADVDTVRLTGMIAATSLTLAEIGAIFVMSALTCQDDAILDGVQRRVNEEEMVAILKNLNARGILEIQQNCASFNLDPALHPQ